MYSEVSLDILYNSCISQHIVIETSLSDSSVRVPRLTGIQTLSSILTSLRTTAAYVSDNKVYTYESTGILVNNNKSSYLRYSTHSIVPNWLQSS